MRSGIGQSTSAVPIALASQSRKQAIAAWYQNRLLDRSNRLGEAGWCDDFGPAVGGRSGAGEAEWGRSVAVVIAGSTAA